MRSLEPDRTRILRDTVSELSPSEAVRKFDPLRKSKASSLKFFEESCDHLVMYSVDNLWDIHGSQRGPAFFYLLDLRDYLLKQVSKPKIQYLREEFERIGVRSRALNFRDLEKHPEKDPLPTFSVQWEIDAITVRGNLFKTVKLNGKRIHRQFMISTEFEELSQLLFELPSGIGEKAFWMGAGAKEAIRRIEQEQEAKHSEFRRETHRIARRKDAVRIKICGGKYAGRPGYLLYECGSQLAVEVEMSPTEWIEAKIPATNVEKLRK